MFSNDSFYCVLLHIDLQQIGNLKTKQTVSSPRIVYLRSNSLP